MNRIIDNITQPHSPVFQRTDSVSLYFHLHDPNQEKRSTNVEDQSSHLPSFTGLTCNVQGTSQANISCPASNTNSNSSRRHTINPIVYSINGGGPAIPGEALKGLIHYPSYPMEKNEQNDFLTRMRNAFQDPIASVSYFHSMRFGADLVTLNSLVMPIFEAEDRYLHLQSPMYVLGDIHGNFPDLSFFASTLWPLGLACTPGKFLFLGDYVDRGLSSLECIAYLFLLKLQYPEKIYLLRGNHETRAVNGLESRYLDGCFLTQCKKRFGLHDGQYVWDYVNQVFDRLPLSAVIDDELFCVHGGIPRPLPGLSNLLNPSQIDQSRVSILESIQKIPVIMPMDSLNLSYFDGNIDRKLVADLLWGDPISEQNEQIGRVELDQHGFQKSGRGGIAVEFSSTALEAFLQTYKFSCVLRAHEAIREGVSCYKNGSLLTIFSTSKDHFPPCNDIVNASTCGCVLIQDRSITALTRSTTYDQSIDNNTSRSQRRRSTLVNAVHPMAYNNDGNHQSIGELLMQDHVQPDTTTIPHSSVGNCRIYLQEENLSSRFIPLSLQTHDISFPPSHTHTYQSASTTPHSRQGRDIGYLTNGEESDINKSGQQIYVSCPPAFQEIYATEASSSYDSEYSERDDDDDEDNNQSDYS